MEVGVKNEWERLEAVALHFPARNEIETADVNKDMYVEMPNYDKVIEELTAYKKLLEDLGITVYSNFNFVDRDLVYNQLSHIVDSHNLIFMRDIGNPMPNGDFIVSNMKYKTRQGEEIIAINELMKNGLDPNKRNLIVFPKNLGIYLEGPDLIWLNRNEVILNIGNRTSNRFLSFFQSMYPYIKVHTTEAIPEGIPQHLSGCVRIVDEDTVILRPDTFKLDIFKRLGFKNIINLKETEEVTKGYASNIVVIGPREIIMPSGNPETRAIYESHGITVHETPFSEISKMGGAMLCTTLIIKRQM